MIDLEPNGVRINPALLPRLRFCLRVASASLALMFLGAILPAILIRLGLSPSWKWALPIPFAAGSLGLGFSGVLTGLVLGAENVSLRAQGGIGRQYLCFFRSKLDTSESYLLCQGSNLFTALLGAAFVAVGVTVGRLVLVLARA